MTFFTDHDGELPRPSDFTAPHVCRYCGVELPLLGLVLRHEERCPMRPANVLEACMRWDAAKGEYVGFETLDGGISVKAEGS